MKRYAIILAAGKGTRMHSIDPNHSKVSYPILGKPIINYVLDALKPLNFDRKVVVVGFGGEVTSQLVGNEAEVVWQKNILGTGHAVQQAAPLLKDLDGETLIIGGMIQETETKSVSKIPFLGDLPFIGMFFRSTGTQRSKEEMVIMLTPQIIVDTEDATEITDLDL